MRREPVMLANLIASAVSALIIALVALGSLPWTIEQQGAVMALTVAIVNVVAALWARNEVTPMTSPQDSDGTPLVREGE